MKNLSFYASQHTCLHGIRNLEWRQAKTDFTPPVHPKTDDQKASIMKTISGSFLFAALEDEQRAKVIDAMSEVTSADLHRFACRIFTGVCRRDVPTNSQRENEF